VRLRLGAGPTDTDVGVPGPSTATARRGPGPPTVPLGSRYRDHARHGDPALVTSSADHRRRRGPTETTVFDWLVALNTAAQVPAL